MASGPRWVIVDTNVLVAALITSKDSSPTARMLDGMLNGSIAYLLSDELLAEYREMLLRPRLARLHGLGEQDIDELLGILATHGGWRKPAKGSVAPDPGDSHLWALQDCEFGAILVTGDKLLIARRQSRQVVNPATFLESV